MNKRNFVQLVNRYKDISIIGMDKNVGKTTVLNYIIKGMRGKGILGLTSIGRDGEETDVVTNTKKPRIYIEAGTIFATAKVCLLKSDITKEILQSTDINTPLGEVIIAKALSDGYVELAGPSINVYIKKVCNLLHEWGSRIVIVDGAINRKSSACPIITQAAILSTGAAVDRDINKVVRKTAFAVNRLSIKKEDNLNVLKIVHELSEAKVLIIDKDYSIKNIDILTSLEGCQKVVENIDSNTRYIVVNGVLSDTFLKGLFSSNINCKDINIIVEDGTKVFCSEDTLQMFYKRGGNIKSINNIEIICVTINPYSPYGYEFKKDEFLKKLKNSIRVPVIDVK